MTIASYGDLQSAVIRWLHRADLTPVVPDLITLCEADMRRRLRTRMNTIRADTVLSAEYSALPLDFRGLRSLTVWGRELSMVEPETLADHARAFVPPACPRNFAIVGPELRLFPVPDQAYPAEMLYYSALPALSIASPTNWLLTSSPDAYLFGTLANSAPYIRDDARLPMWVAAYNGALDSIAKDDAETLASATQAPLRSDVPRHRHRFGGMF